MKNALEEGDVGADAPAITIGGVNYSVNDMINNTNGAFDTFIKTMINISESGDIGAATGGAATGGEATGGAMSEFN